MRIYMEETLQFLLLMTNLNNWSGCTFAKLPRWLELAEWTPDIKLYQCPSLGRVDERTLTADSDGWWGPENSIRVQLFLMCLRAYWLLRLHPNLKMKWSMIRITSKSQADCLTDCVNVLCQCCNSIFSSSINVRAGYVCFPCSDLQLGHCLPPNTLSDREGIYAQVQGDRSHNVCCIKREGYFFGSEWSCCLLVH